MLLALSGLALLLTGLGFLYKDELGWLNTIFGGVHIAAEIHNWGGIVFIAALVLSLGTWFPDCLKWSKEDSEWIGMLGGYMSKDKEPPPQGKINAGQKIVGLLIMVFGILIGISGLFMWLSAGSKFWFLIHNISFLVFALIIPLHLYMATAGNPGTFRIMTRGDVPLYWAKKKHAKWIEETGGK
jgi:formate dehydrogenase subunit gamma